MSQIYFNYQAKIKSLDLSRAISIPKGIGPFVGFGSGFIQKKPSGTSDTTNSTFEIVLHPEYYSDNVSFDSTPYKPDYTFLKPLIDDINSHHDIQMNEDGVNNISSRVNFGLVTKDGYISVWDENTLSVDILNWTQATTPNEVVVVARHNYVSEAIDNPVTLEAYAVNFSSGTQSSGSTGSSNYGDINCFYDLYRRAFDAYYGKSQEVNYNNVNPLSSDSGLKLTYKDLLEYVKYKLQEYNDSESELTLVGIYGKASESNTNFYFAIVPYEGQWPYKMPFTLTMMNSIGKNFQNIKDLQSGFPYTSDTGESMNIMAYIDYRIKQLSDQLTNAVGNMNSLIPSGLICLWDGSVDTIPEGWSAYDKAAGRVVIGFGSANYSGIFTAEGTRGLTSVGSTYKDPNNSTDWAVTISESDIPEHQHAVAIAKTTITENDSSEDSPCMTDWSSHNYGLGDGSSVRGSKWNDDNDYCTKHWKSMNAKSGLIRTSPNILDYDTSYTAYNQGSFNDSSFQQDNIKRIYYCLPSITLFYIQKD